MKKNKVILTMLIVFTFVLVMINEKRGNVNAASSWMQEKKPYQYTSTTEYLAGQNENFSIGGVNYDDGFVFYLWNAARTSQVLYNLKGEYSNFSFCVGHIDGTSMYNASLEIYLDGVLTDTIDLQPSDISKQVSIDVNEVNQLKIKMVSNEALNHYDIYYGVYNGSFFKSGKTGETIPFSNMIGNKEPYQTVGDNTKVIRSSEQQSYFMGGDEYTDCLQMYLWNPASTSEIYFNFGGEYESMSFLFGHIDNTTRADATLEIRIDGELIQKVSGEADGLPVQVTVPLENVQQMVLSLTSDVPYNYYDIYYGIGAIQLTSLGIVRGISLNQECITLTDNNPTALLKATIIPSDAKNQNFKWSSSDESVATVDETGVVKAVSKGVATITATTEDGGYTASCIVTADLSEAVEDTLEPSPTSNVESTPEPPIETENTPAPEQTLAPDSTRTPDSTPAPEQHDTPWPVQDDTPAPIETKYPTASPGSSPSQQPSKSTSTPTSTPTSTSKVVNNSILDDDQDDDFDYASSISAGKVKKIKVKGKRKAVTVSWKKASNAVGYKIYISNQANFGRYRVKNTKSTSVTFKGLRRKKFYYVKVRAYRIKSGYKSYGDWSAVKRVRTK